jgi:hypothetical protein
MALSHWLSPIYHPLHPSSNSLPSAFWSPSVAATTREDGPAVTFAAPPACLFKRQDERCLSVLMQASRVRHGTKSAIPAARARSRHLRQANWMDPPSRPRVRTARVGVLDWVVGLAAAARLRLGGHLAAVLSCRLVGVGVALYIFSPFIEIGFCRPFPSARNRFH